MARCIARGSGSISASRALPAFSAIRQSGGRAALRGPALVGDRPPGLRLPRRSTRATLRKVRWRTSKSKAAAKALSSSSRSPSRTRSLLLPCAQWKPFFSTTRSNAARRPCRSRPSRGSAEFGLHRVCRAKFAIGFGQTRENQPSHSTAMAMARMYRTGADDDCFLHAALPEGEPNDPPPRQPRDEACLVARQDRAIVACCVRRHAQACLRAPSRPI